MRLYFTVPDTLQTQNGTLVRNFLRQCAVSTELARAVKFQGGGFFADGASVLANRRVYPGQVLSFDLPPEAGGVAPSRTLPCRWSTRMPLPWCWKSRPIWRCTPL